MPDDSLAELKELVTRMRLVSIDCVECVAKSTVAPAQLSKEPLVEVRAEVTPRFELQITTPDEHDEPGWFSVRVRVELAFDLGEAAVGHRALYRHEGEGTPAIALLTEFTNEVALMGLIPYLREGLADVTRRVFGVPVTMPMFERGSLRFDVPPRAGTGA